MNVKLVNLKRVDFIPQNFMRYAKQVRVADLSNAREISAYFFTSAGKLKSLNIESAQTIDIFFLWANTELENFNSRAKIKNAGFMSHHRERSEFLLKRNKYLLNR